MPRQPRYFLPNIPQHVVARGVDRQAVFFQDKDYARYRQNLRKAAKENQCQIHAYVLMTNHVHLLVTPGDERALPLMMQAMGRTYVQQINRCYGRSGTLWEGRYKASPVETDQHLLACQRYIELNPVRAGLVEAPGEYFYSSFRHHALGISDPLLTSHANYLRLHSEPQARLDAYRNLFSDILCDELLIKIRENTNACAVIGSERFQEQIAGMLGRAVARVAPGRPRKRP